MLTRRPTCVVCSIGSIDPTSAAGVTADLGVYAAMDARGVSVISGLTAQNSTRVSIVHALPPALIKEQLRLVWQQVRPDAVCIGLVPSAQAIATIADFLRHLRPCPPIVVDPVIMASSGFTLLPASALRALPKLFRLARIITPNVHEAATLSGRKIASADDAVHAAQELTRWRCAVLVKGGHLARATTCDILALPERSTARIASMRRFCSPRLRGSMRGAGGILAAAIAVGLGRGAPLEHAIRRARDVVRVAWRTARPLGSGKPQALALRRRISR